MDYDALWDYLDQKGYVFHGQIVTGNFPEPLGIVQGVTLNGCYRVGNIEDGERKAVVRVLGASYDKFMPPLGWRERRPLMAADWTTFSGPFESVPEDWFPEFVVDVPTVVEMKG